MAVPKLIRLYATLTVAVLLSVIFIERTQFADPDDPNGSAGTPSRYSDIPSVIIDPKRVPPDFRHLINLAKEWSISDDIQLENYIQSVSEGKKRELVTAFEPHMEALWRWHTESAHMIPQPDELVMFDDARNAVETVKAELQERP